MSSLFNVLYQFLQEGSTNHTASKLPTHETTVCPICGTIYVEIYVTTSRRLEVLATRVIPLKL